MHADDGRESTLPARRWWPQAVTVLLLLAVTAVGASLYPAAPDPMPVHFDGALQPDRWGPKSLLGFLAPPLIGLLAVGFLWLMALLMPLLPQKGSQRTAELSRTMLANTTVSIGLLIGTVALLSWTGLPGWAAPWLLPVLLLALFTQLGVGVVRVVRSERADHRSGCRLGWRHE